tara:strand:+ start:120224 stop:120745 length:522 start_codon:yes stop_codon:yes gene_type:complete
MMFVPDINHLCDMILAHGKNNDATYAITCIAYGGDASCKDDDGRNAVHHFAIHGNMEAIQALADDDASYFLVSDNFGKTPLLILAEGGHTDFLIKFLKDYPSYGLSSNEYPQQSVAGALAAHGHAQFVIDELLPQCPEVLNEPVVAMVMASEAIKPTDKIKALRALSLAGFKA